MVKVKGFNWEKWDVAYRYVPENRNWLGVCDLEQNGVKAHLEAEGDSMRSVYDNLSAKIDEYVEQINGQLENDTERLYLVG